MMIREDLLAPENYNLVSEVERFTKNPEHIALKWENETGDKLEITYEQLLINTNKVGNALLDAGLRKGDIILIIIPRIIEAYEVYLAALKLGMVVIPSSEMLRSKDIEYRLKHSEAKGIICHHLYTEAVNQVKEAKPLVKFSVGGPTEEWHTLEEKKRTSSGKLDIADTKSTDMAFLSYTSGTTGNPKGVVHTHGWAYAHLKTAAAEWLGVHEGDVVWATAAPGWQKWIWSPFLSVLGSGATGFVYYGKFNAKKYLQLLQDYKVNSLCCTPTEYRIMAKTDHLENYQLSHLHSAVSAGEPLNREVIDIFKKYFNLEVRDGYGQTESTLLVGISKGMKLKPGSMGKPTPGNHVEIIDENGMPCPVGVIGDIAVHIETPALFKKYYRDPERTAKQFQGDYYITGDKARKDDEGYFWFEGRADDMIISAGYTIGPFEVEDALVKHPYVSECAVVASPDEIRGSIVKAYIVLQAGIEANETNLVKTLQNHVKDVTAPYKYPRSIQFVDELPKTSSGKIRRVDLREK